MINKFIKKQTKKHRRGGSGTISDSSIYSRKINDLDFLLDNNLEILLNKNDLENKLNNLIKMENKYYKKKEIVLKLFAKENDETRKLEKILFSLEQQLETPMSSDFEKLLKNEMKGIKQLLTQIKRKEKILYNQYDIMMQTYTLITNKITETKADINYFNNETQIIR